MDSRRASMSLRVERAPYLDALSYQPSPAMAVAASLILPAAVLSAAPVLGPPALLAAPLGLAGGYVYAGSPLRGAFVGFGGSVAMLAGFIAGSSVANLALGQQAASIPLIVGVGTAFCAEVLYGTWTLLDVHRTAWLNAHPEALRVPTSGSIKAVPRTTRSK